MGYTVQREGYVKATQLLTALVNDLGANGFDLLYLNGNSTGLSLPVSEEVTYAVMAPTTAVDPLAGQDDQPWRLVLTARSTTGRTGDPPDERASYLYRDGHRNWIRFYVCCPEQILVDEISGNWRVAYKEFNDKAVVNAGTSSTTTNQNFFRKPAGMLTLDSSEYEFVQTLRSPPPENGNAEPQIRNGFFYCFNEDGSLDESTVTNNVPNWGKSGDFAAHPLSYRLTLSDHGMAFALWGESFDSGGKEFAWFCTQRMVDKDTGAIITEGKAPLVTVFSLYGNGSALLNEADPTQIQYMITRESDINTPTFPRSAVIDSADSNRIINAVQQVAVGEDKNFIVHFPNGLNTQRYGYPHELDMIAYTSADVVSQENEVEMTFFGEAQPRKYQALAANNTFNKGMRILFQIEGVGVNLAR